MISCVIKHISSLGDLDLHVISIKIEILRHKMSDIIAAGWMNARLRNAIKSVEL